MPTFTYQATAASAVVAGLTPVFVDVAENSLLVDDLKASERVADDVAAFIPVHLIGLYAHCPLTRAACSDGAVAIVEDSAQRLGPALATSPNVLASCHSLGPTKSVAGFGELGALATNDDDVVNFARAIIRNGATATFSHSWIGYNGVADPLLAALLATNLGQIDEWHRKRGEIAAMYESVIGEFPALRPIQTDESYLPSKFCFRVLQGRDQLVSYLNHIGVEAAVHYPTPLHLQGCFRGYGYAQGDFPHAEHLATQIATLPLHHLVNLRDVEQVREGLSRYFSQNRAARCA